MYAVVACSRCRNPWAVELRNATASCPACGAEADLARRTRLWEGDSPQEAQAAVAQARLQAAGPQAILHMQRLAATARPARGHDSPVDAAAAAGTGVRNRSERAEAVARAYGRLCADIPHADLVEALTRAGLEPARSAVEVTRMLACDVLLEPRAGTYRFVE